MIFLIIDLYCDQIYVTLQINKSLQLRYIIEIFYVTRMMTNKSAQNKRTDSLNIYNYRCFYYFSFPFLSFFFTHRYVFQVHRCKSVKPIKNLTIKYKKIYFETIHSRTMTQVLAAIVYNLLI